MSNFDIIAMAFGNFLRRKARSALTISGVVIGVTAIVVMVSIGIGLSNTMNAQMESMGNLTLVEVYQGWGAQGEKTINDKTIAEFEAIDGVVAASPFKNFNGQLISGKFKGQGSLIGMDSSKMELMGIVPESGRVLQEGDKLSIVCGKETAYNFYNMRKKDPYAFDPNEVYDEFGRPAPKVDFNEDRFKLTFDWNYGNKKPNNGADGSVTKKAKLYNLEVVGIIGSDSNYSYQSFMDIKYLTKIYKEYLKSTGSTPVQLKEVDKYDQAKIKVASTDDVLAVVEEVKKMGYQAYSPIEYVKSTQKTMMIIQLVLGGIGGISLLVAAIGIANTMVMSIYERTREIGIMKVLGCKLSDIRKLFLYEAAIIGVTGGIVGLGLSFLLSYVLNLFSGNIMGALTGGGVEASISSIPLWLAAAAVGFAVMVGVVSGLYPARRAMKLPALEAIKTE